MINLYFIAHLQLDYWIPVTQLKGVRGRWRYACSKSAVSEIAFLFAYNFLMNNPNGIILGIYVGNDNPNIIPFKVLQNIFKI